MTTATLHIKHIEEKQDNAGKVLYNIWKKQSLDEMYMDLDLEPLIHVVLNKLREATDVVCLSSNVPLPKEILQEIPKLAQRGVRVYLLLREFDHVYASFVANKAIVRLDQQVVGNMLLIDPKLTTQSGYLLSYNSFKQGNNGTNFYVPFGGRQLKEAYHYFLSKFWSSMEEYRESKINSNSQKLRPPFDIYPLIDPESFFYNNRDLKYLKSKMDEIILNANSNLHIGLSNFSELDPLYSTLFLKAEQGVSITLYTGLNLEHDFLRVFYDIENIFVKAVEHLNNFFVLADNEVGLLLSGSLDGHNEVGISLSSNAVQDFINRLELLQSKMWSFHKEIYLGKIQNNRVFVDDLNKQLKETEILEYTTIDYGEIIAPTVREFYEGTYKLTKKNQDIIAKTVLHRWKLIPPKLDSNAKHDVLYDQWEKETRKLKNYIEQVLEYAKTVGKEKKAAFSSLFGNLFRKEDKVDVDKIIANLELAITQMESNNFKWFNTDELLKSIEQYASKLLEQQLELKEKQDFYEKKDKWEQQRNMLLKEKQEIEDKLEPIVGKYREVELKIHEIEPELQDEITLVKMEISSLDEKLSKIMSEEQELLALKKVNDVVLAVCEDLDKRIKGFQKLSKGERKKYFMNKVQPHLKEKFESIGKIEILNSILESNNIKDGKEKMIYVMKEVTIKDGLKEEIPTTKEDVLKQFEVLCEEKNKMELLLKELEQKGIANKKDEKLQLQKIEKEMQKVENELKQVEKELQKLGEEFSYSSNNKQMQKLPFSTNITICKPKEELPLVGKLYRIGKIRQLAISDYEQLDKGEEEARRLQADLVVV